MEQIYLTNPQISYKHMVPDLSIHSFCMKTIKYPAKNAHLHMLSKPPVCLIIEILPDLLNLQVDLIYTPVPAGGSHLHPCLSRWISLSTPLSSASESIKSSSSLIAICQSLTQDQPSCLFPAIAINCLALPQSSSLYRGPPHTQLVAPGCTPHTP